MTTQKPWTSQYPAGVSPEIDLTPLSMPALLDRAADRFGDRIALSCGEASWTYDEFRDLVRRAAAGLASLGVREGDRVAVLMPNHPVCPVWFFGALSLGATLVSLNPLYANPAIEATLEDSGARVILTLDQEDFLSRVRAIAANARLDHVVTAAPDARDLGAAGAVRNASGQIVPLADLLANDGRFDAPSLDPTQAVAVLQYTGGTTGTPKGAMLTHANLTLNARQIHAWFPFLKEGEERLLIPLPFSHITGITVVMTFAVELAAEAIVVPRFTPAEALAILRGKRPTFFGGVPTVFTALLQAPDMGPGDWESVNCILCGGAPLPGEIMRRFESLSGCKVRQIYGSTELSPAATLMPANPDEPETSVGLPLPGTSVEIRATEDPSRRVAPGETGEIVVAGPQVMKGYWKRENETAQFMVDGHFRTGDLGRFDERGYVFIVDRLKDLIIVSGYNVFPATIENALYTHPAVAEAIVIGAPDGYKGEVAKAFVVLRPGESLTLEGLQAHLAGKLSPMEMPRQLEIRSELPKTVVGKLSRLALKREVRAAESEAA